MECLNPSRRLAYFQQMNILEIEKWIDFLRLKSPDTYQHCVRVAILAEKFSPYLSLNEQDKKRLMTGCFVHDLGKTLIPENILYRKGPLTEKEWITMKLHPHMGADLLKAISVVDEEILGIVRYHHERWDGNGYSDGLKGEEIPFLARVCSVLDAFDSMVSTRAYRNPLTFDEALEELKRNSDTQWDGRIVRIFIGAAEQMRCLCPNLVEGL